jgi:hypothetical protein
VAYIILLAFNISVKVIPPGIHETNSVSNCGNTNENNVNINADNGDEIDVKTNQKRANKITAVMMELVAAPLAAIQ